MNTLTIGKNDIILMLWYESLKVKEICNMIKKICGYGIIGLVGLGIIIATCMGSNPWWVGLEIWGISLGVCGLIAFATALIIER